MGIDSPIDINSSITDQCSGLCALKLNFQDSYCNVSKYDASALKTSAYDPTTDAAKYVKNFKGINYEATTIIIYNNSLHLYNGKRTDAELLILFSGTGGDGAGKTMVVSIPIEQKPSSGAETKINGSIITSIIMAMDSSKVDIRTATSSEPLAVKFASGDTYNLNNIIPSQQPFYTYIGNAPYESSGSLINYVVFPRNSSIYVPTSAIERLNKITTPSKSPVSGIPQNSATYNSAGANASEDSDVYIECSPAGSDGIQLYTSTTDSGAAAGGVDGESGKSSVSFTNIIESDMFKVGIQIILFGFVAILIVFIGNRIFRGVSSSSSDTGSATTTTKTGKTEGKT